MGHESNQTSGKAKHDRYANDEIVVEDDEIEEIKMSQQKTFTDRIVHIMEKFANTRIGQMMIERTDRVLKIVEDTAKWSLPQDKAEIKLERPLPWIFFLPLIVTLRTFRTWTTVASYIVGSKRVTPTSMVYFIQTKRRRLRAIRVQGIKSIRSRHAGSTAMSSSEKKITLSGKLHNLFNRAVCKPGQPLKGTGRRIFAQEVKGVRDTSEQSIKRPRNDDASDHNLTVDEMLEKYANEDSANDSDYIPKEEEEFDDSSTLNTSTSSADETEKEYAQQANNSLKESSPLSQKTTIPEKEVKQQNGEEMKLLKAKVVQKHTFEYHSVTDSDNEQMQTPKGYTNINGSLAENKNSEKPTITTEVAPPTTLHATPKIVHNLLTAPQLEEKKEKSTPGHQSAASMKPSATTATKSFPLSPSPDKIDDKSYRTITTQTSIELDWTITVKTEITHKKNYPKLEKLKCSVDLTPASSTEDIFYSPIGSPQECNTIFQPAPLVKGNAEVNTLMANEDNQTKTCNIEGSETAAADNPKTYLNHPLHNRQYHHHTHNYNAKYRSKNRR